MFMASQPLSSAAAQNDPLPKGAGMLDLDHLLILLFV